MFTVLLNDQESKRQARTHKFAFFHRRHVRHNSDEQVLWQCDGTTTRMRQERTVKEIMRSQITIIRFEGDCYSQIWRVNCCRVDRLFFYFLDLLFFSESTFVVVVVVSAAGGELVVSVASSGGDDVDASAAASSLVTTLVDVSVSIRKLWLV